VLFEAHFTKLADDQFLTALARGARSAWNDYAATNQALNRPKNGYCGCFSQALLSKSFYT
jgi:hypothetical protein